MPSLNTGMEAVIFVGGVSLGQPAAAIPIAAVAGLAAGIVCGVLIYLFASRTSASCVFSYHSHMSLFLFLRRVVG